MLSRGTILQRGTAVTEFILVVPLLAVVLGLTFFFGWTMMHKHQVLVADRYSAWQRVETGAWPAEDRLNEVIFNDRASDVDLSAEEPVTETVDDLVSEAGKMSPRTEVLADELARRRFPEGKRAHVSASFGPHQALWQRTMQGAGSVHHRHGREGVTWRRDEVSCWSAMRDLYYSEFDAAMERAGPPADGMARMIRGLYLTGW